MSTLSAIPALPHLSAHHRHTYEAIFRHPVAHNLEWHDVRSLLEAIAAVTEGSNGSIHATRNGHTMLLHAPKHKEVPVQAVHDIRRFLNDSQNSGAAVRDESGHDLFVLIDHQEAKVYRIEANASAPEKLVPYDPNGHGRHLHSAHEWTDGKRQPERKSYYEAVAKKLGDARRIVLFGAGAGRSNAMDQLMADLSAHYPEVVARVVATVIVDLNHTTDNQLMAQARALVARADGGS